MKPYTKRALKPIHGINLLCNLRSRTKQIYKHNSRLKHSIINTVKLVNIYIYAVESLFYYIKANIDWPFLHHLHLMSLRLSALGRITNEYLFSIRTLSLNHWVIIILIKTFISESTQSITWIYLPRGHQQATYGNK